MIRRPIFNDLTIIKDVCIYICSILQLGDLMVGEISNWGTI